MITSYVKKVFFFNICQKKQSLYYFATIYGPVCNYEVINSCYLKSLTLLCVPCKGSYMSYIQKAGDFQGNLSPNKFKLILALNVAVGK